MKEVVGSVVANPSGAVEESVVEGQEEKEDVLDGVVTAAAAAAAAGEERLMGVDDVGRSERRKVGEKLKHKRGIKKRKRARTSLVRWRRRNQTQ